MSYTDLNESINATFTALQAALAQQSDAVLHEIGCAATQGQTERRDWLTEKARKLRIVEDLVFQAVQGYVEFAHGETPRTPLAPKNIEPIPQTDDRRVVPHRKSPRKGLDVRFGGKHYHGRATRVFTDVLRDIGIEQVKGLRRRVGEHELVTMEPTPKNENHYPGQKQVVWVSIQRAVSLIILVSMLAGPPVRGQVKADKRSRIQQSEVRRTDLQDHLKGYSLIERARGKKVRIELRDGTILSGRVRRIVHAENTSTLFLRMRGMKAPEPVPVDRIETISYRGSVSKGGTVGVILVMLVGSCGGASMTQAGAYLFYGSYVAALALALVMHIKRPHVVIRVVP